MFQPLQLTKLGQMTSVQANKLPDVTAFRYYKNSSGTLSLVIASWIPEVNYLLERPWKDNQPYISCIPANRYLVRWTHSLKFLRYTWQIMDVPNRSGIRIHPGNTFKDSLGCPLTGLKTGFASNGDLAVWNSRSSLENWEHLVDREKPSDKHFYLSIVDLYPFGG